MRPHERDAKQRIECFCAAHPLLALAGQDARTGKHFVWVKTVKGDRIMSEVVLMGEGTIQVRCRTCLRFHSISVVREGRQPVEVTPLSDVDMKALAVNLK